MKLRINDTLVTVKKIPMGIQAVIWLDFQYNVIFDNFEQFIDNIENEIELHNQLPF